jgi:hypothetical protein
MVNGRFSTLLRAVILHQGARGVTAHNLPPHRLTTSSLSRPVRRPYNRR